jgi:hypothetical protein
MHLPANGSIFADPLCKSGVFTLEPSTDLSIYRPAQSAPTPYKNIDRAPEIRLLREESEIEEKTFEGACGTVLLGFQMIYS